MTLEQNPKVTPLYQKHLDAEASLAVFNGYQMPMWYSSAKDEHLSVLTGAGIFDTCHMDFLNIYGQEAEEILQLCFSRDLQSCLAGKKPLHPGKSVYGVILNRKGHVIDDAICSQTGPDSYLLTVNSGMGEKVRKHFLEAGKDIAAEIDNLTSILGKIDLQGPKAAVILTRLLKDPESLNFLPYFSFKGYFSEDGTDEINRVLLKNGIPILVSRTGYTGEFGFELIVSADAVGDLWDMLLESGVREGIKPCGLAARDSLRTGALLPLSHQDIGDWPFLNNPWTVALPFTPDGRQFTKSFIGGDALLKILHSGESEYTLPFTGFDPRKINLTDSTEVFLEGERIGRVLTCTTDMGIGRHEGRIYSVNSPNSPEDFKPRGLSCGFVKVRQAIALGREIEIRDAKRRLPAMIVKDIRPDRTARKNLF